MKKNINDILIEKYINIKNIIVIIIFWSILNISNKILKKQLKEIKNNLKNKTKIIKVNIDFNYYSAEKFSIKNTPTIIIIKNKNILMKKIGNIDKIYFENIIKKFKNEKTN